MIWIVRLTKGISSFYVCILTQVGLHADHSRNYISTASQTTPSPFDQIRIKTLVDIKERMENSAVIRVSFKETALQEYRKYMTQGREKVAKVMVADLFSDEERSSCNCNGRAGKPPLDPVRLEAIREAVFTLMPCQNDDLMDKAWSACKQSIDTNNRNLKRKLGKNAQVL